MKRTNRMKRFSKLLGIVLATSWLFVAQGGCAEAVLRDSIVFALNAEPTTLDAQFAAERVTYIASRQLYDNLVQEAPNGKIIPKLAESWKFSKDETAITFKIRDGVKFHNGEPLTVHDVAYSINRAINETPNKLFSSAMINMVVVDDHHVKLNLKYRFTPILYCLYNSCFGIVSQKAVEADKAGFGRRPVGSGPFKFVSWKSGDSIVFERFEDYWQGPAQIRQVTFKTITDMSTALLALEKGEIHVVSSAPDSDRRSVMNNKKLTWHETPSALVYMITFNNREGLFTNEKLRLAIAYAINKKELIEGALEGNGIELWAPMASFAFGYPSLDEFEPQRYDPEKAKRLLAEAGYPNGLKVTMKSTEAAYYVRPAEIIQDQLRKVGIQMTIQTMERGTYLQEVYRDMKYEMSIWTMTSDYPDGDSPTYTRMHSSMYGNTNNYTGVNIPELDAVLDIGRKGADPVVRKSAYLKVAEITRNHAPLIPLYSNMNNIVCAKSLKGVRAHYGLVVDLYTYHWIE